MTKPMIISAALAATLLMTVAAPGAAFAGTAQLRIGDIDLTSDAGRAELDRRIETAAREACPAETITGSRIPNRAVQESCMADVRQQIETRLAAQSGRSNFGR